MFRDESLRPLTLFKLQCDSWLKFAKMSKDNMLLFLHNISYVSYADKELCSTINIDYFSSHCYGNIEIHVQPYRRRHDGMVVRKLLVYSYCGSYNQGSVLNLLKTPCKCDRPELWQQHLGVLLIIYCKCLEYGKEAETFVHNLTRTKNLAMKKNFLT